MYTGGSDQLHLQGKGFPVLYWYYFCFQDGVLVYGEGASSDLSTVLQSLFCDPVKPPEATDMSRYAMINVMICSQMYELYVSLLFIHEFIEMFLSCCTCVFN
jgi:hypothetical protein